MAQTTHGELEKLLIKAYTDADYSGEPVAEFKVAAQTVSAREYCNKHGLWKA